jgi:hypothetical protein
VSKVRLLGQKQCARESQTVGLCHELEDLLEGVDTLVVVVVVVVGVHRGLGGLFHLLFAFSSLCL